MVQRPEPLLLKVEDIEEDPDNARLTFDEGQLKVLAEDIRATREAQPETHGLRYPIIVRPAPAGGKPWRLVDGARRFRSVKLLGWDQIRAEPTQLDDAQAAVAAASANLQRADLTPYEQARAIKTLLEVGKLQKKEVCERFGIVFNTLKARLQLLELPAEVAQLVGQGEFGMAHAQTLLPFCQKPEWVPVAVQWAKNATATGRVPHPGRIIYEVARELDQAGLARLANRERMGNLQWEADKILKDVPSIDVGTKESPFLLYPDLAAFDEKVAAANEKEQARIAKARAEQRPTKKAKSKMTPAELKAAEEAQRAARLDALVVEEQEAVELDILANAMAEKGHVAHVAWVNLLGDFRGDKFYNLGDAHLEEDRDGGLVATMRQAATIAGLSAEAVAATFEKYDPYTSPPIPAPEWFLKASQPKQQAFVEALRAMEALNGYPEDDEREAILGVKASDIKKRAEKAAKERLKAEEKAEAERVAAEPATAEKPAKKGKKGKAEPEAPAEAERPGKGAKKPNPGLEKAKAKLAKEKAGKQAALAQG